MKWAKGPWWLDKKLDGLNTAWTGSRAICCADSDIVAHTTRGWGDEGLANAQLISAAPELYDALVLAMPAIQTDWPEAYTAALMALAKARGE